MKKLILFLLIPVVMIGMIYTAKAQQVYFGEEVVIHTFFCLEESQMELMFKAHQEQGMEGAQAVGSLLIQSGVCGVAAVPVIPIRVIKTYEGLKTQNGEVTGYHVEVQMAGRLVHMASTRRILPRNEKNPT